MNLQKTYIQSQKSCPCRGLLCFFALICLLLFSYKQRLNAKEPPCKICKLNLKKCICMCKYTCMYLYIYIYKDKYKYIYIYIYMVTLHHITWELVLINQFWYAVASYHFWRDFPKNYFELYFLTCFNYSEVKVKKINK